MRPRTIAPGDFVALIYPRGDEPDRQIALLKLDPDHRLVRTFASRDGRLRVSISAAENLLPDSARLQKCALLTCPTPGDDFEVTLLDTQAGPRAEGIAAFFYRGFLATELAPSARRRTREFLRCSDLWLADHQEEFTPPQVTTFYEARRVASGRPVSQLRGNSSTGHFRRIRILVRVCSRSGGLALRDKRR